jgi:hypothetical protein
VSRSLLSNPLPGAASGRPWPGRVLTRNQAITAMVLAEPVAGGIGDHTDKRWLFIESWANELGITGADAVGKISS